MSRHVISGAGWRPGIEAVVKRAVESTRLEMARADAATRAGECPGYIRGVGLSRERVYCDRGAMHDRHGARGDDRHQADPGIGAVVFWR